MAFVTLPLLLPFLFAVDRSLGRSVFRPAAGRRSACGGARRHRVILAGDAWNAVRRLLRRRRRPRRSASDVSPAAASGGSPRFYNERIDAYDERTSFARSRRRLVLRARILITPARAVDGGEGSGRFAFRAQARLTHGGREARGDGVSVAEVSSS